jgi:hypothetical protein
LLARVTGIGIGIGIGIETADGHRCQCTDGLTYRNCYGVNLECL